MGTLPRNYKNDLVVWFTKTINQIYLKHIIYKRTHTQKRHRDKLIYTEETWLVELITIRRELGYPLEKIGKVVSRENLP